MSLRSAVKIVSSANYTITETDGYETILVTTGSSQRTITLPSVSLSAGRTITIKKVDSGSGTVLIDTPGSETIDGAAQNVLNAQYAMVTLVSDGSNWSVVSCAGEFIQQVRTSGAGISLTTATHQNVTASPITLTPGTWDVQCNVVSLPAGTTNVSELQLGISTTSTSFTGSNLSLNYVVMPFNQVVGNSYMSLSTPVWRVTLTANQNYYAVFLPYFSVSTMTLEGGQIRATRIG